MQYVNGFFWTHLYFINFADVMLFGPYYSLLYLLVLIHLRFRDAKLRKFISWFLVLIIKKSMLTICLIPQ